MEERKRVPLRFVAGTDPEPILIKDQDEVLHKATGGFNY